MFGCTKTVGASLGMLLVLTTPPARGEGPVTPPPPVPKFDRSNPAQYGRALAEYLDRFDRGWKDEYSVARMELRDGRGSKVERRIQQIVLEGEEGDKRVSRFLSPADTKGVAALTHEHPLEVDDTWLYLPASRRVRRISGANRTSSFQGTEFTYEDLTTLDPRRFEWKFLEDLPANATRPDALARIQARPSYPNTGYSQLQIELDTRHWRVERIVFFDLAGRRLKTMAFGGWKHFHDRYWRAMRVEVVNHQTGKSTILELETLFVDLSKYRDKSGAPRKNLDESLFTRRALTNH